MDCHPLGDSAVVFSDIIAAVFVICHLSFVICHLLLVICYLLFVICP